MKIQAEYNYLFEKDELVYIDDPILKIKGLAIIKHVCYLDRLPQNELSLLWDYDKPFPQIIVNFEKDKVKRKIAYPCNEFKFISKLIISTKNID